MVWKILNILLFLTICFDNFECCEKCENSKIRFNFTVNGIRPDILEDALMTAPELMKKYGYPAEIHHVTTDDGYILQMHRIAKKNAKSVVFCMHGLFGSSGDWVFMGPDISLSYLLADQGYDVWLGNARGNRYARNHKTMNTNSEEYWDFSFHEIAVHDLPAMIDYILKETHQQNLHYVGHSQGTVVFFILGSERPEYMKKIRHASLLAPVAYLQNTRSQIVQLTLPFRHLIENVTRSNGWHSLLPYTESSTRQRLEICKDPEIILSVCGSVMGLIAGFNPGQMNPTKILIQLGHEPAGASVKQLIHFAQFLESSKFRQYDYGPFKNKVIYGSQKPPRYNLGNVTAPLILYYSINDLLVGPTDVEKLSKRLPNVHELHLMKMREFTHLDFIAAIDVRELLYKNMVKKFVEIERKYK